MEGMEIDPKFVNFYKDKPIFVTGGNGFIGSNLVSKLIDCGAKVRCLVREYSDMWRARNILEKVEWVKGDLNVDDEDFWTSIIEGSSMVFHLGAGGVEYELRQDWKALAKINIIGTGALIYGSGKTTSVRRVITAGSCFEYGNINKDKITREDTLMPTSIYAGTKAASSLLAPLYGANIGMEIIVLRLFHTYGPLESVSRLIPTLILKALKGEKVKMTKGQQVRDFCYIEDVIDAFLSAGLVNMQGESQKVLNIGSGEIASVADVAKIIMELIPKNAGFELGALTYRPEEIWRLVPDINEAIDLLKWRPSYSLRDGLKKTIEWYAHIDYDE